MFGEGSPYCWPATSPKGTSTVSVKKTRVAAAVVVTAMILSGCRSYDGPPEVAVVRTTTTTASTTTTTTTTLPTTVPAAAPSGVAAAPAAPLPGIGRGATGPEVAALKQRLSALSYDVGTVDANFDLATHHAVMAFQKVQGLPRTARATPDVFNALATATTPGALLAEGGPDRVEIDLPRQVLLLWQGGSLVRTLSISTGTGKRYCVDGQCAKAVTPGGSYRVLRKIKGLRVSRLGQLYNPLYFNGGIAIHGSNSVPAGPASHGCVRIPMTASLWFHNTVPIGTPVYVVGGSRAPVPFDEPVPGEETTTTTAPPAVPDTTTTTAPPEAPPPTAPPDTAPTTTTSLPLIQ